MVVGIIDPAFAGPAAMPPTLALSLQAFCEHAFRSEALMFVGLVDNRLSTTFSPFTSSQRELDSLTGRTAAFAEAYDPLNGANWRTVLKKPMEAAR